MYMMRGLLPEEYDVPWFRSRRLRPLIRSMPNDPRCRLCYVPFSGMGGALSKYVLGLAPSRLNPQICNDCEQFAHKFQGGAEVELTVLFADVRGSTSLAEEMLPSEFSSLINRFYATATKVLFETNAMVEKLIGDAVTGFYVPGFAGAEHPKVAVDAARKILRSTGHRDPSGPWVPVGIGVHTGTAYVGAVTSEGGATDIGVFGDTPNTGARLASIARAGEVVISEATRSMAHIEGEGMQSRSLHLKGRSGPLDVWALQITPTLSESES